MTLLTKYNEIAAFIEALKQNNDILGIIEYGGRTFDNMEPGGDYDVSVIFDRSISDNISGIHFHIQDIPVDCMLLSLDDFKTDYPENPFMLAHLGGTVLFDRTGEISTILNDVNSKWTLSTTLTCQEVSLFRFSFKHILDKLIHRLEEDVLYSHYFIGASVDWMLECYSRMHGLQVGKPKSHLKYIHDTQPLLYKAIEGIYSSNDLKEKYCHLECALKEILKDYGGLWEKNEIIFHHKSDEELTVVEKDFILKQLTLEI